ncbi:MAG: hypothetical protein Kow0029_16470 [Candidatus Rifleibacteriota bacterium]
MLKYYLTTFALSLVVMLRSIFSGDISPAIQFFSLLVLIFSSALLSIEIKENISESLDEQNQFGDENSEKRDFTDILNAHPQQNSLENNLLRLGHLLHLASPKAEIGSKCTYSLICAHEQMPDKIFIFHQLKNGELTFITGVRNGTGGVSERILSGDPIIEDSEKIIKSLIDIRSLQRSNNFDQALSPNQKRDEAQSLLLPVSFFGQFKGVVTVISPGNQGFTRAERKILEFFAESFSILLENHELFEREQTDLLIESELRLSHELFSDQLPDTAPIIEGWDIAVHCRHSKEHSGDFHDFINISNRRSMVIIGKSSGHGIDAAIFFTKLKSMVRAIIDAKMTPAELLNKLTVKLSEESYDELFATMLVLQINAGENEVKLACAGHPIPIVNRPRSGYVEVPTIESGVPIGLFSNSQDPYKDQIIHLLPGDGMFIYTDGVIYDGENAQKRITLEKVKQTMDKIPELSAMQTLETLFNDLFLDDSLIKKPPEDQTGIYLKVE